MSLELRITGLAGLPETLAGFPERILRRAAKVGAERYAEMIHAWIDAGRAFTPRTGMLQQQTDWRAEGEHSAVVYSNAGYAGDVERGTRPHRIEPKDRKALRIPGPDGYRFFRGVNHPGSQPFPFFYVDRENRLAAVLDAVREVIAEEITRG